MKLDNFKELLLKKTEDNSDLQILIKYMKDDFLLEHVIESLEKMAAFHTKKNPNSAVIHFGSRLDPEVEGNMIHDALSHHASQYKAALKAGNKDVANSHMSKIFKIMHMSDKLTRDGLNDHSHGKLKIDAVDPKPWERNAYSNKNAQGKFTTDTKGWGRQSGDYSWLGSAPHEAYSKETNIHGHKGAYPLEEIKVNGKYLDIQDVDSPKSHEEHPFDKHPIMSHYSTSPKEYTPEQHDKFLDENEKYADSEHMNNFFDRQDALGDRLETRGSNKSQAVHAPIESILNNVQDVTSESAQQPTQNNGLSDEELQRQLNRITGKRR